jgi:hypothetical protein
MSSSLIRPATLAILCRSATRRGALFRVRGSDAYPQLTVELRDAFPTFSGPLGLKMKLWVEGLVDHLAAQLDQQARAVLRQRGYR